MVNLYVVAGVRAAQKEYGRSRVGVDKCPFGNFAGMRHECDVYEVACQYVVAYVAGADLAPAGAKLCAAVASFGGPAFDVELGQGDGSWRVVDRSLLSGDCRFSFVVKLLRLPCTDQYNDERDSEANQAPRAA